jgi:hypothetical protein
MQLQLADAALSLPAGRHSHTLAKLAAIEAARLLRRRARRDRPPLRERHRQAPGPTRASATSRTELRRVLHGEAAESCLNDSGGSLIVSFNAPRPGTVLLWDCLP